VVFASFGVAEHVVPLQELVQHDPVNEAAHTHPEQERGRRGR
jgi:hypothetical protein